LTGIRIEKTFSFVDKRAVLHTRFGTISQLHLTAAFFQKTSGKAADDLAQRVIQVLNGHIRSTQSLEMRRKVKK
jgi:putative lipoic acid-binding regulatory protein